MSLVRANARREVGFIAEESRANVALTRAQHGLIIIGTAETVFATGVWCAWLQHHAALVFAGTLSPLALRARRIPDGRRDEGRVAFATAYAQQSRATVGRTAEEIVPVTAPVHQASQVFLIKQSWADGSAMQVFTFRFRKTGMLFVPGGKRESFDRTLMCTALRELHEEVGVLLPRSALRLVDRSTGHVGGTYKLYDFVAVLTEEYGARVRVREPDKHHEPRWMTLAELQAARNPLDRLYQRAAAAMEAAQPLVPSKLLARMRQARARRRLQTPLPP